MTGAKKFDTGKAEAMYFYFPGIAHREFITGHTIGLPATLYSVYTLYDQLVGYFFSVGKDINKGPVFNYLGHMQDDIIKYLQNNSYYKLSMSEIIKGVCSVSKLGAQKYGRNNYEKGMEWSRVVNALGRHLLSYAYGEVNDVESGTNHLFHALANIHMLQFMVGDGAGTNDFVSLKEVSDEEDTK